MFTSVLLFIGALATEVASAPIGIAAAPTPSKKELWMRDKATRPDLHLSDDAFQTGMDRIRKPKRDSKNPTAVPSPPGTRITPIVTLFNLKTREALPLLPGDDLAGRFDRFLRDHFTNQATDMDGNLVRALLSAADRFKAPRIDVVSGYRSPKYNLMLRKKGRQVAENSQHCLGRAVDFRINGVATPELLRFVRTLRMGGVGFYPHSQFIHCDTGPIRFWRGT
jgi:Bacterial protein of unknown function (DUF882)